MKERWLSAFFEQKKVFVKSVREATVAAGDQTGYSRNYTLKYFQSGGLFMKFDIGTGL